MRKSVHFISMKMVFESLSISFCVSDFCSWFLLKLFEKSRFKSLFELVDRICSLFSIFVWYHKITWWWIIWATFVSSCLRSYLRLYLHVFMTSLMSSVIIWYQPIQLRIWIVTSFARFASWLKPREYGWAKSLTNNKTVHKTYNFHLCSTFCDNLKALNEKFSTQLLSEITVEISL